MENKKKKQDKPKYNMWQNTCYMLKVAADYKPSVLFTCLLLAALYIADNLIGLFISPTILGKIENAALLHNLILTILIFILAQMTINSLKVYVESFSGYSYIMIRAQYLMGKWLNKHLTTSYCNLENQQVQKLIEKSKNALHNNMSATEVIWNTFIQIVKNIGGFIIYLIMLTYIDPVIALICITTSLISYFATNYINSWRWRHREEEAQYSHPISYINQKSQDYTLAKDIRIFQMRPWIDEIYKKFLTLYQSLIHREKKITVWANILNAFLALIRNGIAYAYLLNLVFTDGLSASQFLLYFSAVGGFNNWISGILENFNTLHNQSLDISVMREFLEYPEPFKFEDGKPLHEKDLDKYEIEFKNVSFQYPNADNYTLKNINLKIKNGEKLAIVGLNGAGKTTLTRLVLGLYDPTDGEILLNGKDIRQYNRQDYYKLFSAVGQQFSQLESSIAINIAQTEDNIEIKRIKKCVHLAGLTQKIEKLPNKYDTNIGKKVYEDGIELSGGETQRFMLARALYKNAPMMILDEPTAALDPISENDIYNKYNELTKGKTSIYISHRLASTRFCDRIIFLKDGEIAEEGTHSELLKNSGGYADLFHIQSKYYKEGVVF